MMAGTLDKRIRIQAPGFIQDGNGETVPYWYDLIRTDGGYTWASIVDITGKEYVIANAQQSEVQTKITIRYRPDILPVMRVLHEQVVYEIMAVLGQNRRTLLLMCKTAAPLVVANDILREDASPILTEN